MTPERHENFAENLRNLRAARNKTVAEFAEELAVPKSTLQKILETGQTTLTTAIQISESIGVPLDTLTNGRLTERQMKILDGFMHQFIWYNSLTQIQREEAESCMTALIRLIEETPDE